MLQVWRNRTLRFGNTQNSLEKNTNRIGKIAVNLENTVYMVDAAVNLLVGLGGKMLSSHVPEMDFVIQRPNV